MTLMRQLRREEGELGLVSALLLLAGVLLPIMFIVVGFARIENGRLAAAQAARDAIRAAVEAPTPTGAPRVPWKPRYILPTEIAVGAAASPCSGGSWTTISKFRCRPAVSAPK